jgi:hypothetical protein
VATGRIAELTSSRILGPGHTPVEHASLADPFVLLALTAAGCAFAAWRFRWR